MENKYYKVLVCGGRDYDDKPSFFRKMDELASDIRDELGKDLFIINGGCPFTLVRYMDNDGKSQHKRIGADYFARVWAKNRGYHCATVPALWDHFDKRAGPVRNEAMTCLDPERVIAFGGGRGTQSMINIAQSLDIPVTKEDT